MTHEDVLLLIRAVTTNSIGIALTIVFHALITANKGGK